MDYKAGENVFQTSYFDKVFNTIKLKNYSKEEIKYITFTFLIYPEVYLGVNRNERKHYNRKEKHLFLDIKVDEYQEFCNADKETSLQILKRNLLRGVKKFLENQKDFNFIDFYNDLQKIL